jgi:probable HAF family extracellular repeat protein
MQDLGTLGGPNATAFVINERGHVTGSSYTNDTPNAVVDMCGGNLPTQDPFLWKNGRMIDLGSLGGTCGFPSLINNRDQIVGQSDMAGDVYFHPFLWDDGILSDLGTFGGHYGQAIWLNDAGQVVGWATNQGDQAMFAALWRDGEMINLGTVPGDDCSTADGINARGQVVGASQACDGSVFHAFLWEHGGPMVDLNTLIPSDSPLLLRAAYNINDRGEIAGIARLKSDFNKHRAFLLIPDGSCGVDCEERLPGSQNGAAATTQNVAARQKSTDSAAHTANQLRPLSRRYHTPVRSNVPSE